MRSTLYSLISVMTLLVCLLALLLSNKAMAETAPSNPGYPPQIIVSAEYDLNFTHHDGSGLHFELMKAVYEPLGIEVKTVIEPFKRARLGAIHHKADVMVGTYSQDYRGNTLLLTPKYPIGTERVLAVFPSNSSLNWQQFYQYNGVDVNSSKVPYRSAWVIGYDYSKHLRIKKVTELRKMQSGLKMVANHRLDVFIDAYENVMDKLKMELPELRAKVKWEVVLKRNTYMAFSNSPKAAQLCRLFDQRMEILLASGELKTLYERWGANFMDVEFNAPNPHQRKVFCQHSE